jgi:hypothetical protein
MCTPCILPIDLQHVSLRQVPGTASPVVETIVTAASSHQRIQTLQLQHVKCTHLPILSPADLLHAVPWR